MSTAKEKHLEFIQGVITRMAKCSFMIKGWAIAVLGAFFAFYKESKWEPLLIIPVMLLILGLWGLDAFFLWQERLFRGLYDKVRLQKEEDIDFSMKRTYKDGEKKHTWFQAVISRTLLLFYCTIIASCIVFFMIIAPQLELSCCKIIIVLLVLLSLCFIKANN